MLAHGDQLWIQMTHHCEERDSWTERWGAWERKMEVGDLVNQLKIFKIECRWACWKTGKRHVHIRKFVYKSKFLIHTLKISIQNCNLIIWMKCKLRFDEIWPNFHQLRKLIRSKEIEIVSTTVSPTHHDIRHAVLHNNVLLIKICVWNLKCGLNKLNCWKWKPNEIRKMYFKISKQLFKIVLEM